MATDVTTDLSRLAECGTLLAVKVYRVQVDEDAWHVPVLPCLDHEAMLHQHVAPHVSVYLRERGHDGIHEVAVYSADRRLQVDLVSTSGEHSDASQAQLLEQLRRVFGDYRLEVHHPSWWRGERRVTEACRAQITLRQVLIDKPSDDLKRRIDRLQLVGALMEKQSRVASWGVRTMTGPLLAATGVVLYGVLGLLSLRLGMVNTTALQYAIIGTLGAIFLYYRLKAVQLTDMANRVWKRASEYSLILSERTRIKN